MNTTQVKSVAIAGMMSVMYLLMERRCVAFCHVIVVQSGILVVPKTNRKQ